jgi:hypothetical protein
MFMCVRAHAYVCACVPVQEAWACAFAYARVALLIQHAKHMSHIVTSFVASGYTILSTFSRKRHDFR